MLSELKQKEADKILRGMVIPPRPSILLELEKHQQAEEADFDTITRLISDDMTLSAAVLKTVNSPFFQLPNRVASVQQALQYLGLNNVSNIVRGLALRQALSSDHAEKMESFWISSTRMAHVAAHLASKLHGYANDEAYTFGLFHNCGMPLMQARFADYQNTINQGERLSRAEYIELENRRHHTSHNVVGYLLGRTWYLPEHVNLAILNHHDYRIFNERGDARWHQVANLVALASLAEHVVRLHSGLSEHAEWRQIEPVLLNHLGFVQTEFEDYADESHHHLETI